MELVEAKKSAMVGYQWRLEAGAYCAVNHVSLIRQCMWRTVKRALIGLDWGVILSAKTLLSLTFDFGAVDG